MRTRLVMLMAALVFATVVPGITADHSVMHTHTQQDADCAKECDLLLRNCALEVDSIHQRIERIKKAIDTYGAKPENLEELKLLNKKLKEANDTLKAFNRPGR